MVYEYLNNNKEESLKLQLKFLDLIDLLFIEVNPIPVKSALNILGIEAGSLRLPLTDLTKENYDKLKDEINKLNLI